MDYWYSYGTFDQHGNPHYWDNDCVKHEPKQWSPTHEADVAISYINNDQNQRDKANPFCLFFGMNPPHNPYSSLKDTDSDMYHKYYSEEKVPNVRDLFTRPNVPEDARANDWVRYYFSSVSGVDREFGRIMDALEASGEKDNTIVVFSADHGEMMGSHDEGAKNIPQEESYLIPYVIRYPEVLEHRIEDLMFGGPDVMPTLLALSGLSENIPEDLDGTDYQRKGVRTERYTFVIEKDTEGQFNKYAIYDNEKDPYQMINLEFDDLDKDTLEFLKTELGYWLKKSNDLWYQERVFESFIIYP